MFLQKVDLHNAKLQISVQKLAALGRKHYFAIVSG